MLSPSESRDEFPMGPAVGRAVGVCRISRRTAINLAMQSHTTPHGSSHDDAASSPAPSNAIRFERPTIEEISLCCEISAYAPDGDEPPLF